MTWLWVAFAAAAGGLLAVQPTLNAEVGRHLGGPMPAAAVNFMVGLAALVVLAITLRGGLPQPAAIREVPWWAWGGGLIGATIVATAAFLAPRIGVTALIAAILLGQLAASLVLDHYGLFNMPVRELSWARLIGVVMAGAGVLLVTQD